MRTLRSGALVVLLSAIEPAFAASATGSATVTILRPVAVTKNTDLAFGKVIRPSTGSGTITIPNNSDTASAGGTNPPTLLSSTRSHATFTIAGEGGQVVSVTVPATITLNGPSSSTLTVNTTKTTSGTETLSGNLGDAANGTKQIGIGGSITIASSTTAGAYAGSFNVSADYQ